MKSSTTAQFRKAFAGLQPEIKEQTREAYRLFEVNPEHPSLHFKSVHPRLPIHSARVNKAYRVLGTRDGDEMIWWWVGQHDEYERLIASL
jgi:hypothetical protein